MAITNTLFWLKGKEIVTDFGDEADSTKALDLQVKSHNIDYSRCLQNYCRYMQN